MLTWIPLLLPLVALLFGAETDSASLIPHRLRTENRTDPIGVDARQPRFSWLLEATDPTARGLVQSGYEILVASSEDFLGEGNGDLWHSGLVSSSQMNQIVYKGQPLQSGAQCFWKVRVRDGQGSVSDWSKPARWTVGLLEATEWNASWIGHDAALELAAERPTLRGASWIQYPDEPADQVPAESRYFRSVVELPSGAELREATMMITADDVLELRVNGEFVIASDSPTPLWKSPASVRLDRFLVPGRNVIAVETRNLAPGPTALIAQLVIETAGGERTRWITDSSWKCSATAAEGWAAREFDDSSWTLPRVVGEYGVGPWGAFITGDPFLPPARLLRREFEVTKSVRRAVLWASALGVYELRLNGERVGDHYFDPGWTDYAKRVYCRGFDVTGQLHPGGNAIGALLGDGWHSGYVGYKPERDHYGRNPRFSARLRIEYTDGSIETVASDDSWRATTGPIIESDFLMGEVYDARRELDGWDLPGFDSTGWASVDVTERIDALVQTHPGPPVRAVAEFPPIAVGEPRPGVYVLDLGQNLAGFCRLRMKGKRGQVVQLRFAERLNPDGTLYVTNLRAARASDTYVFRGSEGPEEWEPHFTFHGFQYVEVTGLDTPPTPGSIVGVALTSDTPLAGRFECSDETVNQLVSNILWTQRSNFIDIPTDCPQRDERLGWTGDAQIYVHTATLLTDAQAFFTKWLVDLEDAQREDGQFPMVAPLKVAGGDGGPGWADAGTICPWAIYEVYGDQRLLAKHYPAMVRYVEFCRERSQDGLLPPEQFHCFGDWVSVGADTPKKVIYTAYYAHSVELTARAAEALGHADDAARFRQLFADIKDAFIGAYVDEEGKIHGHTQCGYVLALAFDLLEGERREQAAGHLVERIEARDGHLSTGFLGTKDLMLVLSKIGRENIAYQLLHNKSYPSWGFSIEHGATSIWERWNGWTPEQGFMDPGMNSFAHYSFGAVGQWLFENVGGIRPAAPGFERIELAPRPGGQLTWAKVEHDTIRGTVVSRWAIREGVLFLEVTVPPNTTARIHVPADRGTEVTEAGKPAKDSAGLTFVEWRDGAAIFEAKSGSYRFASGT